MSQSDSDEPAPTVENVIQNNNNVKHFDYISLIVQPKFQNYQLLGDSIFVRFADKILDQPYQYVDGVSKIGYCVGGQRIKQLAQKLKKNVYYVDKKVLLLIGTNDVLNGRTLSDMIYDYNNLIMLLQAKKVSKIVILTLPPIPRLALTRKHWELVRAFNAYLIGLSGGASAIKTIDILPLFVKYDPPIIAAPPVIPTTPTFSLCAPKRKLEWSCNGPRPTTPKRKRFSEDPTLTSEDDSKVSEFGRYLNNINRLEAVEDRIESDEDEANLQPMKPYIEFPFWRKIERFIQENPQEDYEAPFRLDILPGLMDSPTTGLRNGGDAGVDELQSPSINISDNHKLIIQYTRRFLRINYYEMMMGMGPTQRMDMIHPNTMGLSRLRDFLVHSLSKKPPSSTLPQQNAESWL